MSSQTHYTSLARMYLAAPINQIYVPTIEISEGRAEISIEADERFFHSAGALHGSVYFKLLDDAAFFAANSLELETFVLTASFTTYLLRPITGGRIRAVGMVQSRTRNQFLAEAVLYDAEGHEAGRGNGLFAKGRMPLVDALGYAGTD
ncbi:MAG: PaaI family thioesterase [Candidatus Dadabacteria bacterium]|nr:MAG: PaaI family thioesterase [Candidatus Dadabacteria bacterium]